jgi:hypothetical protein
VGGGVVSGMPTLERQEVSAPSWETCLRLPISSLTVAGQKQPPFRAGVAYLFGIFKPSGFSEDVRTSLTCYAGGKHMLKREGKIGAIRRNVHGKACVCCGSQSYQLVLRTVKQAQMGKLFARCTQCHRTREIDEDLGRILWM